MHSVSHENAGEKKKKLELKHERRTCENRRENAKAAKLRTDSKRMAKPILDMF